MVIHHSAWERGKRLMVVVLGREKEREKAFAVDSGLMRRTQHPLDSPKLDTAHCVTVEENH